MRKLLILTIMMMTGLLISSCNYISPGAQRAGSTPAAPNATPAAAQPKATEPLSGDPLLPSLKALGFNTREELIKFFAMEGVSPDELHGCPGELACVAVTREKDAKGNIVPFKMTNPTSVTFDGWRAAGQPGGQAKVPPGTWYVEGVTIRPWR